MKCLKCGSELTCNGTGLICTKCKGESQQIPEMYGWICPRCGTVHSPFITQCGCPPPIRTWNGVSTEEKEV